ncbi:MAG: S46 family peptidase [Bacteroidales bacterium]|nr:S46 family peptidase [Bacteroidales bacterium]
MRGLLLIIFIAAATLARADVGMWIPMFLNRNIDEMHKQGLRLSAEEIYSVNNASLKDAVVIFGGGCTGEVVSEEGLLLTNYHCGYDAIQKLSSVTHNYLANGYWAMSREEELPCDGLSVSFLESIEDVTERVLADISSADSDDKRAETIKKRCREIESAAMAEDKMISASVESFYAGNQYLLYRYKVYSDIRLVGAPPSSIGKFGGDTDNWVWPRHTGDFSIFRIYADKENNPAPRSSANVPYRPKKHLKISTKGIKEGDFTMVIGYPGSTKLYSPSVFIEQIQNAIYPRLIEMRGAKLDVMNRHQAKSEKVDIQYAYKNSLTSNAWKKWQGEIKGLKKTDAIAQLRQREMELCKRNEDAKGILKEYESIYDRDCVEWFIIDNYYRELIRQGGIELCQLARKFNFKSDSKEKFSESDMKDIEQFYRNFDKDLSQEMAIEVLKVYCRNTRKDFWPEKLAKGKTTIEKLIGQIYSKSLLADEAAVLKLISKKNISQVGKALRNDPAIRLQKELHRITLFRNVATYCPNIDNLEKVHDVDRRYLSALIAAYPDSLLPSDANFTMRVAYGHVAGYDADDAVSYEAFTTLDGIIEKNSTGNPDYEMPEKLKDLYKAKDYGQYADADGKIHTAFVATNHTTGGNSGSPVLNADGELIGLNFDRAWNGVMSDMYFNSSICRNITVDIRYLLFIVDKFAGAKYLVDEMLQEQKDN